MMNKKGIFFTVLVITLISLFLVSYSAYSLIKNRESINKRIDTMNNFVLLVEQDLPRKLYISGFRVIFLLENKIIEEGNYIDNATIRFEECFFNGTIYEETQDASMTEGVIFSEIQDNLNEKASKINVKINLSSQSVSITQEDPWNVKVSLTTDLLIEDKGNLALWNRTFTAVAYIPIENFEDPLYIIETKGLVSNGINRTIYKKFITGGDISNLSGHVTNSYYKESTSAPSFLDRLEGRLDPNDYGIESMVNRQKLEAQGISTEDRSCIDYIYFDSSNNFVSCKVTGMPSWFRIDDEDGHFNTYDITGSTYDC